MRTISMFSAIAITLTLLQVDAFVITESEKRFPAISGTICYPRIGCLETTDEWKGSGLRLNPIPLTPEEIDTTFHLYSRENEHGERIFVNDGGSVSSKFYNADRDTKFIIHGFLTDMRFEWIQDMTQALLSRMNVNVIVVDYYKGARNFYSVASSNARIVGLEIAYLINTLTGNRSAESFHLIGHSLGAHVAGYAGEKIRNLGRITGLDPAGPQFNDMPRFVRLDTTDAKFVDVIHTDAETVGWGFQSALGHVDFYPNQGVRQPGCIFERFIKWVFPTPSHMRPPEPFKPILWTPICSHDRAIKYFIESITSSNSFSEGKEDIEFRCQFLGFMCRSYKDFLRGDCVSCGTDGKNCCLMGIDADKYAVKEIKPNEQRKFYLNTNDDEPFCGYHYALNITIAPESPGKNYMKGDITVNAYGDAGDTMNMEMNTRNEIWKGKSYNFLGFSSSNAGHIARAEITWKSNENAISKDRCLSCLNNLFVLDAEFTNLGYYPESKFKKSHLCHRGNVTELEDSSQTLLSFDC